jgi:Zn-dependent M16 (insulinase) family peptidase
MSAFRERVLNVSEEAIKKACAKYLTPQTGITSVITSAQSAKQLNLEIKNL